MNRWKFRILFESDSFNQLKDFILFKCGSIFVTLWWRLLSMFIDAQFFFMHIGLWNKIGIALELDFRGKTNLDIWWTFFISVTLVIVGAQRTKEFWVIHVGIFRSWFQGRAGQSCYHGWYCVVVRHLDHWYFLFNIISLLNEQNIKDTNAETNYFIDTICRMFCLYKHNI